MWRAVRLFVLAGALAITGEAANADTVYVFSADGGLQIPDNGGTLVSGSVGINSNDQVVSFSYNISTTFEFSVENEGVWFSESGSDNQTVTGTTGSFSLADGFGELSIGSLYLQFVAPDGTSASPIFDSSASSEIALTCTQGDVTQSCGSVDLQVEVTGSISAEDMTETPLPATLPLFATGLAALGLFGWRRNRGKTPMRFAGV